MGFLRRILEGTRSQEIILTLIGPPNAGKTTFVRYLETGKDVHEDISTTLGIELRSTPVVIDNWRISVIDTGGQEIFAQTFWEIAIEQADAVMFVIDATVRKETHPEKYDLSLEQFNYALDVIPEGKPLLFLLNKQDLTDTNPIKPEEAMAMYKMDEIKDRSVVFIPTSAKYGEGVEQVVKKIVDLVVRNN